MSPGDLIRNGWSRGRVLAQEHIVHAGVVTFVILAATFLRATGHLDNNTVAILFSTAIGYAAGRSGTGRHRGEE